MHDAERGVQFGCAVSGGYQLARLGIVHLCVVAVVRWVSRRCQ